VAIGRIFALGKEFIAMKPLQIETLLDSSDHGMRVGAVSIMEFQAQIPMLLGVPCLVPLAWPGWILDARLVRRPAARVVAGRRLRRVGRRPRPTHGPGGYWTWAHPRPGPPGIDTVPLTNLGGWLLAGLVLKTLLEAVVTRIATVPRTGDAAPLLALGWMTVGGALAYAGWLGLPGSAAWGAILAVPMVVVRAVQRRARP
jgi:putative membrane protein